MKKLISLAIAILLLAGLAIPVLASDISGAPFRANVVVSNNSTATTNVATVFSANTSAWQDLGYINSSGNNSALQYSGSDVEYMPGYDGNPWAVWVSDIATQSYQTDLLYLGGTSSMDSAIRYFPADDGMTTSDNASQEWSDNATFGVSGWIDTDAGVDKNIYYKHGAAKVYVSPTVSGNITADILSGNTTASDELQYSADSENNTTNAAYVKLKEIILTEPAETVRIKFDIQTLAGDTGYGKVYKNGVAIGTEQTRVGTWVTKSEDIAINAVSGDLIQLYVHDNGIDPAYVRNFRIYYGPPYAVASVSATSISSGTSIPQYGSDNYFFGLGTDNTTGNFPASDNLIYNSIFHDDNAQGINIQSYDRDQFNSVVSGAIYGDYGRTYDGSDDVITLPADASLRPTDQITLEVWIRWDRATSDDYARIIHSFNSGDNSGWEILVGQTGTDTPRIQWNLGVSTPAIRTLTETVRLLTTGVWSHWVWTYDKVTMRVYRDGIAGVQTVAETNDINYTTTKDVLIGSGQAAANSFGGVIGEVRIYDRALTQTEITSNYNATKWRYDGTWTSSSGSFLVYNALPSGGVPDNSNDIVQFTNSVMPWVEYSKLWVDGVLQQFIEWEYGSVFHNQAHGGDDATPSFRTTSSDADVTASLTTFAPVTVARAPAFSVSDAPLFLTDNITVSGNFTTSTIPSGGPPGSGVIEEAATASGTPSIWIWGILAICALAAIGLFIAWMERKYGSGGGSLLLRVIIGITVFGVLIAWGKFDWWMLVLYLFVEVAIMMMSKQGEVGGNMPQHGLIGFLAQSWVGLTIINRIMEGQFITGNERLWANYFAFTQDFKILGRFNMPVLNLQFFTHGIPSLLKWDYAFFGGNAQLFQYMLYSLIAVASFIIFTVVIGLLYNAIRVR